MLTFASMNLKKMANWTWSGPKTIKKMRLIEVYSHPKYKKMIKGVRNKIIPNPFRIGTELDKIADTIWRSNFE